MMNWEGYERKRSWSLLKYYYIIYLKGLRKTTKTTEEIADFRTGNRTPDRKITKHEVLHIQPRRLVISYWMRACLFFWTCVPENCQKRTATQNYVFVCFIEQLINFIPCPKVSNKTTGLLHEMCGTIQF